MQNIILASTSSRRQEMLGWLGVEFRIASPGVDESRIRDKDPAKLAALLADAKAMAVADTVYEGLVVGSDTVISLDGRIIEKASDEAEQRELINFQLNKCPEVISGVCIVNSATGEKEVAIRKTSYRVANVAKDKIEAYIASGQGLDKGGGFGLQDENNMFLERMEGCYTNSIGFPLCTVSELLRKHGVIIGVDPQTVVAEKTGREC